MTDVTVSAYQEMQTQADQHEKCGKYRELFRSSIKIFS
jgi:hypothetical protein